MTDRWRTMVVLVTMSVAGAVASCARDDDGAGPAATTRAGHDDWAGHDPAGGTSSDNDVGSGDDEATVDDDTGR